MLCMLWRVALLRITVSGFAETRIARPGGLLPRTRLARALYDLRRRQTRVWPGHLGMGY
jgi:hypothetical protein